ncbi:MAG: hypothetical protein R3D33_16105 [Hyphomicrobiaceae bacterium]
MIDLHSPRLLIRPSMEDPPALGFRDICLTDITHSRNLSRGFARGRWIGTMTGTGQYDDCTFPGLVDGEHTVSSKCMSARLSAFGSVLDDKRRYPGWFHPDAEAPQLTAPQEHISFGSRLHTIDGALQ